MPVLVACLRQRQLLIALDGFEHLFGGATLLTDILQAAQDDQVRAPGRLELVQDPPLDCGIASSETGFLRGRPHQVYPGQIDCIAQASVSGPHLTLQPFRQGQVEAVIRGGPLQALCPLTAWCRFAAFAISTDL